MFLTYIISDVNGYEEVWIIGDQFVAASGNIIEDKRNAYVNRNYQVSAFGGNPITSQIPDPIARLRNVLVTAFQRRRCIPKIIAVICEADLINAIKIQEYGTSEHYGQAIEWLADEHVDIIDKFRGYIPAKAKKNRSLWPFIVWIAPSIHDRYEEDQHMKRRKMTKCLEKIAHGDRNITALRLLKHVWDQKDKRLLDGKSGDMSALGWSTYWDAIDNTIQYFDEKVIPTIIDNKKSSEFTFQRYKEYQQERGVQNNHYTWKNDGGTNTKSSYSKSHWSSKNKQGGFNEPQFKKSFGRNHWQEMNKDQQKRKLPSPK